MNLVKHNSMTHLEQKFKRLPFPLTGPSQRNLGSVDLRTMVFSVLLLMLWSLQLHTCFTMSNAGSSELNGGSLFDPSFWYSFTIGYVCSATGIIFAFMCFCVPWAQLKKAKRKFMSSSVRSRNIHAIKANQVPKLLLCMLLLKKGNQEVLFFLF